MKERKRLQIEAYRLAQIMQQRINHKAKMEASNIMDIE